MHFIYLAIPILRTGKLALLNVIIFIQMTFFLLAGFLRVKKLLSQHHSGLLFPFPMSLMVKIHGSFLLTYLIDIHIYIYISTILTISL